MNIHTNDTKAATLHRKRDGLQGNMGAAQRYLRTIGMVLGTGILLIALHLMPKAAARPLDSLTIDVDFNRILLNGQEPLFVGTFIDKETNEPFDLYDSRTIQNASTTLAAYYAVPDDERLQARDWKDCKSLTFAQEACCHTAHGLGKLAEKIGIPALVSFITVKINQATSNGRDAQKPRSICHNVDNENVCISWAEYNSSNLPAGASDEIARFAAQCAAGGLSSEIETRMANGSTFFLCVSNRAKGCDTNVG